MIRRLGLGLAALASGCLVQRGPQWVGERTAEIDDPVVSLVLLGHAGAPGTTAEAVADAIGAVTQAERNAGSTPMLVWLGDNILDARRRRCPEPAGAWSRPGSKDLASIARTQIELGSASFAVLGPEDWRCDLVDEQLQSTPDPHPWRMPAHHYIVRIDQGGTSHVVSECEPTGCTIAAAGGTPALVELVFVDLWPWLAQPQTAQMKRSASALDALLEAIEGDTSTASTPRILVSSIPLEAAGYHGLGGGGTPYATFHNLPKSLQRTVRTGAFSGIVAAYDRALYADSDITPAIQRSDRVWLDAPVFQIVSGAASRPVGRPPSQGRQLRRLSSIALDPGVYSPNPGFAVLRIGIDRAEVTLHARRAGRWTQAGDSWPLRAPPRTPERVSPSTGPCLRCDEVPPSRRDD